MAEKLVRDLIPYRILEHDGKLPPLRIAKDKTEALHFLLMKLDEEVAELKAAMRNPAILGDQHSVLFEEAIKETASEAGDVLEVLRALVHPDHIAQMMREKRESRGGFNGLVIVNFPDSPK